jgi:hypothetical protein
MSRAIGGGELARMTGAAYCLHHGADVLHAFTALHDGDTIELGNTHRGQTDLKIHG